MHWRGALFGEYSIYQIVKPKGVAVILDSIINKEWLKK